MLRRDEAEIHVWAADDETWRARSGGDRPVRSGAESFLAGTASCRIECDDVDDLWEELRAQDVLHQVSRDGLAETDFGTREFSVLDLDGNLISFFRWRTDPAP